ncbi:hypothetical protein [Myxacorys almedinensis]|uniref:UspA domain-containing protein n=1 Tax=Myxacorys almedinensis A TaxID=2690445 RepID=A0A8J7YZ39_9CYAN|nr:hypothetical protein [Myxacorys almedinensis]NDJ16015.1 hypothetical protein [Myxacorys almedinensis A]
MFQKILVVLDTADTNSCVSAIALAYAQSLSTSLHLVYPFSIDSCHCSSNLPQSSLTHSVNSRACTNLAFPALECCQNTSGQRQVTLDQRGIDIISFCYISGKSIGRIANCWNADLIILGQTLETADWVNQERLADQVSRYVSCSILLVQQHIESQVTSIQMMLQPTQTTTQNATLREPTRTTLSVKERLEELYRM